MIIMMCILALCSNDPFPLGDEIMVWDPVELGVVSYYETCRFDFDPPICMTTIDTAILVSGTPLIQPNDTAYLRVRACNHTNQTQPPGCSDWSAETVEFLPYACFRGEYEEPCYPGAPQRFPHIPWSGVNEN